MEETTVNLVERFGLRFEEDGLPRIAGRMLGLLMVSAEPRSLEELSAELQASRTSASTNARLLERMGAVERTSRPGDRRDYYRIVDNLHVRMLEARIAQMRVTRDLLADAIDCTSCEPPEVQERLCAFAAFFGDMVKTMESARRHWFERNGGTAPAIGDGEVDA